MKVSDEQFYGDPAERFRAMQKAGGNPGEAHFRMWCGIAADEIERLRNALKIIASGGKGQYQWSMTKAEKLARETLTKATGKEPA